MRTVVAMGRVSPTRALSPIRLPVPPPSGRPHRQTPATRTDWALIRWELAAMSQTPPLEETKVQREGKKNLAARAGIWSARHRKTATIGWLVFVVLAVFVGSSLGMKELDEGETGS